METLTAKATDISCAHCKQTIERELSSLPGIRSVSVDVPAQLVTVSYDPGETTEAMILGKLEEEGYPAAVR